MRVGIASLFCAHGHAVTIVEKDESVRETVQPRLRQALRVAVLHGRSIDEHPAEVTATDTLVSLADADLLIEAVTEDLDVKREVLARLVELTDGGRPIVSNTSSIPIRVLGEHLPAAACLIGVHFMNPPLLMPVVEMIPGPGTSPETIQAVERALRSVGRQAVTVQDSTGFVTSRLLHSFLNFLNEAMRIVAEGVASADVVDLLARQCLGHRTGPLETADLIGLDNLADSLRVLARGLERPELAPSAGLTAKVDEGLLGRKSGRGYHAYTAVRSD